MISMIHAWGLWLCHTETVELNTTTRPVSLSSRQGFNREVKRTFVSIYSPIIWRDEKKKKSGVEFLVCIFTPSCGAACLWIHPPQHIYTHRYLTLHSCLLLLSFSSFSSFFLPPVCNWILFSGCYKCLCLLCFCLAPHFLSLLLHRRSLVLSFPSLSPSVCGSATPFCFPLFRTLFKANI